MGVCYSCYKCCFDEDDEITTYDVIIAEYDSAWSEDPDLDSEDKTSFETL